MSTDIKVLVIEDAYTSRISLIRLLEICGIHKNTIFSVTESACAIMASKMNEFHMVVMNIRIPDAVPMVKFIHHLRPATKIIGIFSRV